MVKTMINFDDPAIVEAYTIYGFKTAPDPIGLSIRQVEIIEAIAVALKKRDTEILNAVQRERQRILQYLELHEYDMASGLLDPITALRRELSSV